MASEPDKKFEKLIKYIGAMIEVWRKKKLVLFRPLLPFGTLGEAHAHCTHLQIAQADTQTEFCKRGQLLPTLKRIQHYV